MSLESDKTSRQAQADACKIEPLSQESIREFLLASVRCARVRVQLLQTEIDEIGIALKFQMVTPEVAVSWLHDIDALRFVNADALEQVSE